ncbi:hypothetical protein G647_04876 [Cladophialophora carrionii CBS 160.54]|uniref:Major facilitator superfamily (MFS) profile domain-containing protein n=1 Tax=Cladophialophora carrionii CBS 160.54 TaxID=1279043 RepID=V9D894_9EURO|nr:uncharacterized protein G647_04876 [Cladophialophora carrionii CBS 160.54]ETI23080.1 hypothetical protein G647_04876 [Cladophialophora carrionii CBS 160.54]
MSDTEKPQAMAHEKPLAEDTYLEDDPHRAALEDNPDRPEKLTWGTVLSIFFLGLAFVGPVSGGFLLITAILFQIGTELGDVSNIAWMPGGWSIASSVSFSIAGSLSDIFGRRYVTLSGQLFAVVGAIVGATAQTTTTVVVACTLLGFATGIIFVAYAGIPELLPNKWRNVGLAWTEGAMAIPWAICGVIIANELVSKASWRWCFYIAIIYAVISFVGTALVYFPPSRPRRDYEKTRWQEIKEIDYMGIILYTSGLTVFLVGLTWAGTPAHPWKSASVIAPIVIGVLVFIACFVYDFIVPKQPFFPLDLFRRYREFTVLLVVVFVAGMIFYSMSGILPQGTLYMFESDGIQIGLTQLPNGIGNFVGGTLMPAIAHKIKHLKMQMIVALTIQLVFVALYSVAVPQNKAAWMAFQFFGQGCFGMITLLCYFIAGLHVPLRELGIASGLIGTFRSAGGSVGNAIFNTILTSVVTVEMPKRVTAAALAAGFPAANLEQLIPAVVGAATGVPNAFGAVEGATPEVQAATLAAFRGAYGYAFKRVFWATIPFGVIAIVAACFVLDSSQYLTNHTAVRMEKDTVGGAAARSGQHQHQHQHQRGGDVETREEAGEGVSKT